LVGATACGRWVDSSAGTGAVVRDSAGVRVVENLRPEWGDGEGWTVGERRLVIGGSPDDDLFSVADATLLPLMLASAEAHGSPPGSDEWLALSLFLPIAGRSRGGLHQFHASSACASYGRSGEHRRYISWPREAVSGSMSAWWHERRLRRAGVGTL
jgi:hypothetical protein